MSNTEALQAIHDIVKENWSNATAVTLHVTSYGIELTVRDELFAPDRLISMRRLDGSSVEKLIKRKEGGCKDGTSGT